MHFLVEWLIIFFGAVTVFYVTNFTGLFFKDYGFVSLTSENDGEPAFNFLYQILSPNICVILIGFLLHLTAFTINFEKLWLIVPFQIIFRIFFNFSRLSIINWNRFLITNIISVGISYIFVRRAFVETNLFFPSLDSIGSEFWILLILYIYSSFTKKLSSYIPTGTKEDEYILRTFRRFSKKYGNIVNKFDLELNLKLLVYSIMITENFNRPFGVRLIERVCSFFKKTGTYGIMQIKSDRYLSDEESVIKGCEKIIDFYDKVRLKTIECNPDTNGDQLTWAILERVVWFYNRNPAYVSAVISIKEKISDENYFISPSLSQDELDEKRLDAFFSAG